MNAANDAPAGSGPIAPESERVRWVYTRAPAIVAVVAAAVRLVYWLHVRANDPFYAQVIPNFDMYTYWTWGRAIAGGDWLSRGFTEGRPFFFGPLYPYLLGVVFSIFGENFDVVHGLQAAMGVAAPLFVWSMARRLFGAAEGLAAGLLAAVCGLLVFNEQLLLMEGVVVALHAAMLWCVVRSQFSSRRGWLWMAASGGLLGVASWGRGNVLLVAPLFAGMCLWAPWLRGREGRREEQRAESTTNSGDVDVGKPPQSARRGAFRSGVVAAAAFCAGVMISPWVLAARNAAVSGQWMFTASSVALNLYRGNAYDSQGLYGVPPSFDALVRRCGSKENVPWMRELEGSLRAHPGAFARVLVLKTILFWNDYDVPDNANYSVYRRYSWVLRFNPITWGVLVSLAAVGIWRGRRGWREQAFLYVYAAGFSVSIIVVVVVGRYRMPLVAPLCVWAGAGIVGMARDWRERNGRRLARAVLVALAGLMLTWPRWSPGLRLNDPGAPWWRVSFIREVDFHNLATAHFRLDERDAAIAWLVEGLEVYPADGDMTRRLATAYVEEGALDRAREVLEAYLARRPEDTMARGLLRGVESRLEQQ